MPDVKVSQLNKRFGDNIVLEDVDFTIRDGEFFTLLGPSGCGKSTTLNCIAGLEEPTSGAITVADETFVDTSRKVFVPPEGRNLGMVFQSYALWPHKTIADNLAMPLQIRKIGKDEQRRLIDDALDKVGLAHLRDRYPHQLSGGQQQRQRCCCSTSPSRTSTQSCASRPEPGSSDSRKNSASPPST
jgi:iron(III) transport system ATP-binding protein